MLCCGVLETVNGALKSHTGAESIVSNNTLAVSAVLLRVIPF